LPGEDFAKSSASDFRLRASTSQVLGVQRTGGQPVSPTPREAATKSRNFEKRRRKHSRVTMKLKIAENH
jgi:hypothetical protein